MKRSKTQKGITLVALIITIVILTLLAAVTISSIEDDGILQHAINATNDYNKAMQNGQAIIEEYKEFLEN